MALERAASSGVVNAVRILTGLGTIAVVLAGTPRWSVAAPCAAGPSCRTAALSTVTPTPSPTPFLPPTPVPLPGSHDARAAESVLTGDCDNNNQVTIDELILGINIALDLIPVENCRAFDADGNGRVTIDELITAINIALSGPPPTATPSRTPISSPSPTGNALTVLSSSSPVNGEGDVAITRETILRFSAPLRADSVTAAAIHADFGGVRLPALLHLSPEGTTATLFYQPALPASARIRVTVDGTALRDQRGQAVDVTNTGTAGGVAFIDFDTLNLTSLPGTAVCGRVFASALRAGDDGGSVNEPLEGVTITVDGMEETVRAVTDRFGDFRLEPAPVGAFFVHIDGRTASNGVPAGGYYPYVGKKWVSVAGAETNIGEIYLPLVAAGTLQAVSATQDTTIHFPPSVLQDFPEFSDVRVTVPADSLYSDDGSRGGMVGIAPVPPDRIPGPLPPGLDFPVVITVQTDGASNFDKPVPVCFPNLPDAETGERLPPGADSALWSFNHDTGQFEVVGPMKVSADGALVCTNPGVGILAPGWHGTLPGVQGSGGPMFGPAPCPPGGACGGCPICDPPCPTCGFQCACQSCGDGVFCPNCGEECDEGENNGGPDCTADCKLPCDHPDSPGCAPPPPEDSDCATNVCNPDTGECELQPMNAGGPCEEDNPCSMGGTCDANGHCDALPDDTGICDDGIECTTNDHCENGSCTGDPAPAGTECCGNGVRESGEECDDGPGNSDTLPEHCRLNCSRPFCGDGVRDPSGGASGPEECDNGEANNSNTTPNACRSNCTLPRCGDAIIDTAFGEQCDQGNDNSFTRNSCRPDCTNPRCGDGLVDDLFGETCDAGGGNSNTIGGACRENCRRPRCGDGVMDPGEGCDDGNNANNDGCDADCRPEMPNCGNGTLDSGEGCDDGNTAPCDGCSATCTVERCGNGIVECGELCDNNGSNNNTPNACRADCTLPRCGDGITDSTFGEECDDGNPAGGDGCGPTCRTERCGNFILDPGEACDDGNVADCDGCKGDCQRPDAVCGDGTRECGEGCDNGPANSDVNPGACRTTCAPAGCGDHVLDPGEGCDDGNTSSGDGCSGQCQPEGGYVPTCGNGILDPGEQCDDGAANANSANHCRPATCELPRCGDGIVDSGPPNLESCDDGNTMDGDACPANCSFELQLDPRLIVGVGLCTSDREIRVTEVPSGRVLTTDPDVEYEFICQPNPPNPLRCLDLSLVTQVWTFLRNRQMQEGVPADELLPEQPPIADIEVTNGQVHFKSEGINVLRARRGDAVSNLAFVIGGMQLVEAESLKIKPFTLTNLPVNALATLMNKGFKAAGQDLELNPAMFLFLGQLCFALPGFTPGDVGFVGVEELKFELFGGRVKDLDLMDGISTLVRKIPLASPIRWLAEALAILAPPQLLEFSIGDDGGQSVISVSENFSLTEPPFLAGVVEANSPGIAVVEAKFEMECVGEAEDDMLVFVAPELNGVDIRSEAGLVEDPLLTPQAPAARRPHAVGYFNVLGGRHQLVFKTPAKLPEDAVKVAKKVLPGGFPFGLGVTVSFTFPPGASLSQNGFYEDGDFFAAFDDLMLSFSLGTGKVTLAIGGLDIQTPIPNLATTWEVWDPTLAVLDANPSPLSFERELSCTGQGDTLVQVDACFPGASVTVVSDLNGVHCKLPTDPCGDAALNAGETCDPPGHEILDPISGLPTGEICRGDCTFCGDGIVQTPEEDCDDGTLLNTGPPKPCLPNCRRSSCGNGMLDPGETCDPPGVTQANGNLCRSDCTFCGDTVTQPGEQCDDGAAPGGCGPNCALPVTPMPVPTATPTATALPSCGDGVVQPPEQCDDGNTVALDGCEPNCTITAGLPLPNELCITEVVTDPRSDWSDSTVPSPANRRPFDPTPGPGPVVRGDPRNEYIEIRNASNRTLTLAGLTLRMTDRQPATYQFGNFGSEHYLSGQSAFFFPPGAVVVIGDPPGELDDDVFLELISPAGTVISDLEVGGNFSATNFEADDDRDGLVNEDGPDGLDNDGDGLRDEDGAFPPFHVDPIADGAPGPGLNGRSTGTADEALHRVADTPADFRNFERGPGTPGVAPDIVGRITIDEVVTRPLRDWNDSTGAAGRPFDINPGPGAADADDEYIEIRNRNPVSSPPMRLRDMVLQINDSTPAAYRIGSGRAGTVEAYTAGSSADSFKSGAVLVIGNPPGEMDDNVLITLGPPCARIPTASVKIGGSTVATNFAFDEDRDGRVDEDPLNGTDDDGDGLVDEDPPGPNPVTGAPLPGQGLTGEALRRVADTGIDAQDFVRGRGDPGVATGPP